MKFPIKTTKFEEVVVDENGPKVVNVNRKTYFNFEGERLLVGCALIGAVLGSFVTWLVMR